MSSYSPSEPSAQPGPTQSTFSQYPEPGNSPRAPFAPVFPSGYGYSTNQDPSLQQTPPQQDAGGKPNGEQHSRSANRLRKACDNCSIRKVKCDEGPAPCKACLSLEIECTFNRPTKRRGPPNKLAEQFKADKAKKQKLEGLANSAHYSHPSDALAAQSLTSLANHHGLPAPQPHGLPVPQPEVLSVYSIIEPPMLFDLISDYFTFIHPVIPMPHQPTFDKAFNNHMHNPHAGIDESPFVALVASMISVLTSSFPRRPLQILQQHGQGGLFRSSMSLIEKCQDVVERTRHASYNRRYTVNDSIISYLQGVLSISLSQEVAAVRHFKDCLADLVSLGLQKASVKQNPNGNADPNLALVLDDDHPVHSASQKQEYDVIDKEMARRVFWNCFASVKSREQLGIMPSELCIPPPTKVEPWPELPSEFDDVYISSKGFTPQPPETLSELVGFNINIKIFDSYRKVSHREIVDGVDMLVDWKSQKREISESLGEVKKIVNDLPEYFRLSTAPKQRSVLHPAENYPDPETGRFSARDVGIDTHSLEGRKDIMINIQKANIHATQLGTRSFLVEKFFSLSDANRARRNKHSPPPYVTTAEDEELHSQMTREWSEIINSLMDMINTIDAIFMEPNGASLVSKIRSIARTLIGIPEHRRDVLASRNGEDKGEMCLKKCLSTLAQLEKTVNPSQEKINQDDEENLLRLWANLRDQQQFFLKYTNKSREAGSREG